MPARRVLVSQVGFRSSSFARKRDGLRCRARPRVRRRSRTHGGSASTGASGRGARSVSRRCMGAAVSETHSACAQSAHVASSRLARRVGRERPRMPRSDAYPCFVWHRLRELRTDASPCFAGRFPSRGLGCLVAMNCSPSGWRSGCGHQGGVASCAKARTIAQARGLAASGHRGSVHPAPFSAPSLRPDSATGGARDVYTCAGLCVPESPRWRRRHRTPTRPGSALTSALPGRLARTRQAPRLPASGRPCRGDHARCRVAHTLTSERATKSLLPARPVAREACRPRTATRAS